MPRKRAIITCAALAVAIAAFAVLLLRVGTYWHEGDLEIKPRFWTNSYGQTYAEFDPDAASPVAADPATYEEYLTWFPELTGVTGEDGVEGYVYTRELYPATYPDDAVYDAYEVAHEKSSPVYIPLFDRDGQTQIGLYRLY